MDWIKDLLWGNSVAHTTLILALVIIVGSILGRIRIKGISLGSAMVLFVGIGFSHFGLTIDPDILLFAQNFALIFFVYAMGLQVGPGFASAFKHGGVQLNFLAFGVVALGVVTAIIMHYITQTPMDTMVGILTGSTTSTPALAAAEETFTELHNGVSSSSIALGYAVSYPFGVLGVLLVFAILRSVLKVDIEHERKDAIEEKTKHNVATKLLSLQVDNPALFGKSIQEITSLLKKNLIISRIKRADKKIEIASSKSILYEGDIILITSSPEESDSIVAFIGQVVDMKTEDWTKLDTELLSRKLIVTKQSVNGKTLAHLDLRNVCGANITRINRAGIELIAKPDLELHLGDRVMVVGTKDAINHAREMLGNEVKRLSAPNIIPIFIGISLGVMLGSIPFAFPGVPKPVKLGLSGGMIVVAMLMSVFGPKLKLATYTTTSANLMMRELGITIFLACMGLSAGGDFVDTLVNNDGLSWVAMGAVITIVPITIIIIFARLVLKLNYLKIMGFISGCTAGATALDYATSSSDSNAPLVSYAAVYPLGIFLRVIIAQVLILSFT